MVVEQDHKVDTPTWLYEFQAEDVVKLVEQKGCLLANEMGTGKTYQAIALDLLRREGLSGHVDSPVTLVIAPLSTLDSVWKVKYEELAPHLKTYVINPKARGKFLQALKAREADVYILHWDVLRLMPELRSIFWRHIIADEAHRAKSRKAQQTRALKKLRTTFKTALTGTPVTNKPQDLWSILNWLFPTRWRSFWRFYESYVNYEILYPHGYHKLLGPKNERALLELIEPYYVRHLKSGACCPRHPQGVMPQLPDKYYDRIWVDLYPKQRRAYDQMQKEMIAWLETQDGTKPLPAPVVIAQLVRLQQFAAAYMDIKEDGSTILTMPSSKVDALLTILKDNPDEPIVVFSTFRRLIDLVEVALEGAGLPFVKITGDVSQRARETAVADFQAGRVKVFLGTIGAGGEGITLTASSTVIFLDRDWSPARNSQAEDRLHRGGQENAVQIIDIMAKSTVDLGKAQKLEIKADWIRRILGDT